MLLMLFCSFFAEIDDTHITEEYKSLMSLADHSDGVTDIIINVCMTMYIIIITYCQLNHYSQVSVYSCLMLGTAI